MVDRVLRQRKVARQVLISTHSGKLLAEIDDPKAVLLLEATDNGSTVRSPDDLEIQAMTHGLNAAEVLLPKARPDKIEQMGLFG